MNVAPNRPQAASLLAAACLLACSAPAGAREIFHYATYAALTGAPTVVGFDERPAGTLLSGTEYPGLTVSGRRLAVVNPEDFAPGLLVGGQNVQSPAHGLSSSIFYSGPTLVFDNGTDDITFTLATPRTAAGLWIGNLGNDNDDPITPTVVSFFDTSGALLASETFTQGHEGQIGSGANNRVFYGLVSDVPIASFRLFNGAGDFDGVLVDDVQWSSAIAVGTVPGSPTLALAALGLGLLRLTLRRPRGERPGASAAPGGAVRDQNL